MAHQAILDHQVPERIEPPGLREIKQKELFKKWRPYVPEEIRNTICPEPAFMIEEANAKEEEKVRQKAIKDAEKAKKASTKNKGKRKAVPN